MWGGEQKGLVRVGERPFWVRAKAGVVRICCGGRGAVTGTEREVPRSQTQPGPRFRVNREKSSAASTATSRGMGYCQALVSSIHAGFPSDLAHKHHRGRLLNSQTLPRDCFSQPGWMEMGMSTSSPHDSLKDQEREGREHYCSWTLKDKRKISNISQRQRTESGQSLVLLQMIGQLP